MSEAAVRGWELFRGKAGCASCHAPPLFMDFNFHNAGVGSDAKEPDKGRGAITKDEKDNGKFKTPGLRSVSKTGPYFHDGSEATLDGAVRRMVAGGVPNANLDERLKPVELGAGEMAQLMAFLMALESSEKVERPQLPQ